MKRPVPPSSSTAARTSGASDGPRPRASPRWPGRDRVSRSSWRTSAARRGARPPPSRRPSRHCVSTCPRSCTGSVRRSRRAPRRSSRSCAPSVSSGSCWAPTSPGTRRVRPPRSWRICPGSRVPSATSSWGTTPRRSSDWLRPLDQARRPRSTRSGRMFSRKRVIPSSTAASRAGIRRRRPRRATPGRRRPASPCR